MNYGDFKALVAVRVKEVAEKKIWERAIEIFRQYYGTACQPKGLFQVVVEGLSLSIEGSTDGYYPTYIKINVDALEVFSATVVDRNRPAGTLPLEGMRRIPIDARIEGIVVPGILVCGYHPGKWDEALHLDKIAFVFEEEKKRKEEQKRRDEEEQKRRVEERERTRALIKDEMILAEGFV